MITISAILITSNGKYLLVQENKPDDIGWTIPAGKVRDQESPEEGAIREAKEETGLEVKIDDLIDTLEFSEKNTIMKVYKARAIGGNLRLNDKECMGMGWFDWEEIKHLSLRRKFIKDVIEKDINRRE
ncbi:MAG TPA: NUDIX hydrolase [Patescibacteria group bacterium]|nr:NUDIX hydrolase [Patescibacteria group bacterium]